MFAAQIARLVFSFSLVLAAIVSWADYRELDRAVRAARTGNEVVRAIERYGYVHGLDSELREAVDRLGDQPTEAQVTRLRSMVAARAIADAPDRKGDVAQPAERIRAIKSSPIYRDPGIGQEGNWLSSAFRRLGDALERIRLPNRKVEGPKAPAPPSLGGLGQLVTLSMWIILGALVVLFLVWAIRQFSFSRARKLKKLKALLEDDEPERTADEWLTQAAQLEREGRFREAVRCLYLACLVRVDEAQIARFVRSETNWEHYSRIQASPRRPTDLDFLPPTRLFDLVWYGHQTRGIADLEVLRSFYSDLLGHIEQMRRSA